MRPSNFLHLLLFLPPLLVAQQPEKPEAEKKRAAIMPPVTADEAVEYWPHVFDFSEPKCRVDTLGNFLTVKILTRRDDVMAAIREAMDLYGFTALPENPRVSSENRYVYPGDLHDCYFMWYGLGTNDMMFVRHSRFLSISYGRLVPRPKWSLDTFHRLLQSRLSAKSLSDSAQVDTTRILSREPKFYEEYMRSTGPEHYVEYDENGNLIKFTMIEHY